jgi:SAM-dependent methyltransferase
MRLSKRLKKAIKIYRREGAVSLLRSISDFIQYRTNKRYVRYILAEKGIYYSAYHKRIRTDSKDRWEMMSPFLSSKQTALDIGCASGYFTSRLADKGYFTLGIDVDEDRLESARREYGWKNGLAFSHYQITPTNISQLPEFDIIFLLTVYHHWCYHFGYENAEQMLRELGKQADKIFFEPPGKNAEKLSLVSGESPSKDTSIKDYYIHLIQSIFDNNIEIEYIGEAEYPHEINRSDPIFLINCEEYNN